MRSSEKQWKQTGPDDGTGNYWQRKTDLDENVHLINEVGLHGLTGSDVKTMKKKTGRA